MGFGEFAANGDPNSAQLTVNSDGGPEGPGPCGHDYRVEVAESPTAVIFRPVEIPHPSTADAGYACTSVGAIRQLAVQLESALGGRILLREDHGHGVPVEVVPERAGGPFVAGGWFRSADPTAAAWENGSRGTYSRPLAPDRRVALLRSHI